MFLRSSNQIILLFLVTNYSSQLTRGYTPVDFEAKYERLICQRNNCSISKFQSAIEFHDFTISCSVRFVLRMKIKTISTVVVEFLSFLFTSIKAQITTRILDATSNGTGKTIARAKNITVNSSGKKTAKTIHCWEFCSEPN